MPKPSPSPTSSSCSLGYRQGLAGDWEARLTPGSFRPAVGDPVPVWAAHTPQPEPVDGLCSASMGHSGQDLEDNAPAVQGSWAAQRPLCPAPWDCTASNCLLDSGQEGAQTLSGASIMHFALAVPSAWKALEGQVLTCHPCKPRDCHVPSST